MVYVKMPRFLIKTLGCKINQADSEKLAEALIEFGFNPVVEPQNAEIIIINTCTVTAIADRKSRQIAEHLHQKNPHAKIILTGCGVKNNPAQFEKKDGVVLASSDPQKILAYLVSSKNPPCQFILRPANGTTENGGGLGGFDSVELNSPSRREVDLSSGEDKNSNERTRAQIVIQTGCENFCSYCIVPFVRGRSHSRPQAEIIAEIQKKEQAGFREIILTGINLGAYGASLTTKPQEAQLDRLLDEILKQTGIPRIRLSSLGPQYFSPNLIRILQNFRLCPHLHLSLQSASNRVLKRMNRPYTIEMVLDLMQTLRQKNADFACSVDLITGFPGETEEEHRETMQNLAQLKPMKVHLFPYSVRPGTVAATLAQVPQKIKMERKKEIARLAQTLQKDFYQSQIGKTKQALFEFKNQQNFWEGYTENYLRVQIKSAKNFKNKIKSVVLTEQNLER